MCCLASTGRYLCLQLLTDIGVTPLSKAEELVQKLHEGENLIDGIDQLQFTQWVKQQVERWR